MKGSPVSAQGWEQKGSDLGEKGGEGAGLHHLGEAEEKGGGGAGLHHPWGDEVSVECAVLAFSGMTCFSFRIVSAFICGFSSIYPAPAVCR